MTTNQSSSSHHPTMTARMGSSLPMWLRTHGYPRLCCRWRLRIRILGSLAQLNTTWCLRAIEVVTSAWGETQDY
ncbi:hypothetical protein E2C01_084127 [Portunus trituberculatus]|uniref:Uncharacterized protein n=1 Tax=Portunus trituberculatus TaxID=210409 RepID=A0A5B7IUH0_PORTR|nr:hypothetical protein [Portunus trituberculatus]